MFGGGGGGDQLVTACTTAYQIIQYVGQRRTGTVLSCKERSNKEIYLFIVLQTIFVQLVGNVALF